MQMDNAVYEFWTESFVVNNILSVVNQDPVVHPHVRQRGGRIPTFPAAEHGSIGLVSASVEDNGGERGQLGSVGDI